MKISRTVTYAVQSLLLLAQANTTAPVPCGKLAASGRMPERFLLQILRTMVRHGILTSVRGVDGGYLLAKPLEEITLLDVFESFDDSLVPSVPPLEGLPDNAKRVLRKAMGRVASVAEAEYTRITIADLATREAKSSMGRAR